MAVRDQGGFSLPPLHSPPSKCSQLSYLPVCICVCVLFNEGRINLSIMKCFWRENGRAVEDPQRRKSIFIADIREPESLTLSLLLSRMREKERRLRMINTIHILRFSAAIVTFLAPFLKKIFEIGQSRKADSRL